MEKPANSSGQDPRGRPRGEDAGVLDVDGRAGHPGRQFNKNNFGLSFGLENELSFGLRFPTLMKNSTRLV